MDWIGLDWVRISRGADDNDDPRRPEDDNYGDDDGGGDHHDSGGHYGFGGHYDDDVGGAQDRGDYHCNSSPVQVVSSFSRLLLPLLLLKLR